LQRRHGEETITTMPDTTTTVAQLREAMARFVGERDWQQFHSPKNLVMALSVEVSELMEQFLWIENAESHQVAEEPEVREEISDELADVAGVLFALCNALNLDLSDAVARKMAKNVVKYPVEKSRGRYRIEE
jgi:NTP pyrophosphatase (non-canonical NTP hydrolase)